MQNYDNTINSINKTKNNIEQLCDLVNQLDKSNGGNGHRVNVVDFSEPINDIYNNITNQCADHTVANISKSISGSRIARTWSNQHPKSLNDLDLSFFNLNRQDKGQPSWCDTSWKNDSCPSFTIANGSKDVFVLYLDHKEITDRENDEDRFYLRIFPRIDDGSTDDIDLANGDEPVIYSGSDFDLLITVIKNNILND
jgi:hypothetical protein